MFPHRSHGDFRGEPRLGVARLRSGARQSLPVLDDCVPWQRSPETRNLRGGEARGEHAAQGRQLTGGEGVMSEVLARAIIDKTANPFVVVDLAGNITFASSSIYDLGGWRADELVGRNMVEFLARTEQQRAVASFTELQQAAEGTVSVPIVFEMLKPSGESIWCEVGALRASDLADEGLVDCVVLRLRSWTHNHHFDNFLDALLRSQPFPQVAEPLCWSISMALQADGALLHHGFDGSKFLGADGAGVPRACAPVDEGPWHDAATSGRPVFASTADLPPRARLAAEEPGFAAIWCVPITGTDRLPRAVLSVWRRQPGPPLLGSITALSSQTRYAQLAVQRWAEHQRLIHIAGHDSLTGVANRSAFRERLARALAIGEEDIAVAFCDLDSFKPVNDTYGHQTGDRVLVEVANRLRRSMRAGDELARLGGDEFTVLMRNVPDATAAQHLAERILAACKDPFDADGDPVKIGISVGIALVDGPTSAEEILARADAALYEAKRQGGNRAQVSPG